MAKVPLTKAILEFAFSDIFLFPRGGIDPRDRKRALKEQLYEDNSTIVGRKLKRAINVSLLDVRDKLDSYLQRRLGSGNAWRTMVLLITLPEPSKVVDAYCSNGKRAYTPQDFADILQEEKTDPISKALHDFKRNGSAIIRWSDRAIHIRQTKVDGANMHEWWTSIDEDKTYEEQKVHLVLFYVPRSVTDLETVLKHPMLKATRERYEQFNPRLLVIPGESEFFFDVVTVRQSEALHSRFYVDGKRNLEVRDFFIDTPLASKPNFL